MYSTQDFPSKYYKMLHPFFKKKQKTSNRPSGRLDRPRVSKGARFPSRIFPRNRGGVWQFLSSGESWLYPGKHTKKLWEDPPFLMGKSTISVFIKNENLIRISFSGFELDSLNQQTWWFHGGLIWFHGIWCLKIVHPSWCHFDREHSMQQLCLDVGVPFTFQTKPLQNGQEHPINLSSGNLT